MHYTFSVIPKDWAKRRKPKAEAKVVKVDIPDFQLVANHFCNMHVSYDDGSEKTYFSRVIRNHITGQWTVDGMHVCVKVNSIDNENL